MRNAMFFPNRILYREKLLSTTVTYAVDLSETEFLHLKPVVPIYELGIRSTEFRLYEGAEKILERYAINELHYLASVNADIARVQYLVENWDYREVGHITIGSFRPGHDGGYAINDGNHRNFFQTRVILILYYKIRLSTIKKKKRDFFPILVYTIIVIPQNHAKKLDNHFAAPNEDKGNAHPASTSGNFGN